MVIRHTSIERWRIGVTRRKVERERRRQTQGQKGEGKAMNAASGVNPYSSVDRSMTRMLKAVNRHTCISRQGHLTL